MVACKVIGEFVIAVSKKAGMKASPVNFDAGCPICTFMFQGVDAPRAVNEEGMGLFLSGITDEMKQKRREQLLDVSRDQVREVAQKYLVDALKRDEGRIAFLGEKRPWVDETWTVNEMNINGAD